MTWSHTFPLDGDASYASAAFWNQFIAAVSERTSVSGFQINNPAEMLVEGDIVTSAVFLANIQRNIEGLSRHFIKPGQLVSTGGLGVLEPPNRQPETFQRTGGLNGRLHTDVWQYARELINGTRDINAGPTRRFFREIQSLSSAGEAGQVARFVNSTPVGNFWALYVHNGQGWERHQRQHAAPDVIEEYGHARPGDIIGTWIFDEMHFALRLLQQSLVSEDLDMVGIGAYRMEALESRYESALESLRNLTDQDREIRDQDVARFQFEISHVRTLRGERVREEGLVGGSVTSSARFSGQLEGRLDLYASLLGGGPTILFDTRGIPGASSENTFVSLGGVNSTASSMFQDFAAQVQIPDLVPPFDFPAESEGLFRRGASVELFWIAGDFNFEFP